MSVGLNFLHFVNSDGQLNDFDCVQTICPSSRSVRWRDRCLDASCEQSL